MSYRDWHVGMRVVCVDAEGSRTRHKPLSRGAIYTIRKIWAHPATGAIGVLLDEITNDIHPHYKMERGYEAQRFRPVRVRKTDISIFTAMLHDQHQKVSA